MSRYDCGDTGKSLNEFEHTHWIFDHLNNPINQAPDLTVVGSDQLVVSYSTIATLAEAHPNREYANYLRSRVQS